MYPKELIEKRCAKVWHYISPLDTTGAHNFKSVDSSKSKIILV